MTFGLVKHNNNSISAVTSVGLTQGNGDYMVDIFSAGYFNTTSALDAVQFKFESGNIDAGTIKLYGVS